VSFSLRFFPDGLITRKAMKEAELAARRELQLISHAYRESGWERAVGSSGTAKAIVDLLELNGLNPEGTTGITREGLERLKEALLQAGGVARLDLQGLRADRVPVLPGGVAIMSAVFRELGLARMEFSEGALRLGVLYDLLGRYHHEDLREATVTRFMHRYEVDRFQAGRVHDTALRLLRQLRPELTDDEHPDVLFLSWAARLHEIGISVAHSSYHKHSAYILANADMPGFSNRDQARLARIVLAHRGKLDRVALPDRSAPDWLLIFALRLAVVLHRARDEDCMAPVAVSLAAEGFHVEANAAWLAASPLTSAVLNEEARQWTSVGFGYRVHGRRGEAAADA